jgi:hypothetical protein
MIDFPHEQGGFDMTRIGTRGLAFSAAVLSLCISASPAYAQATRTWVSGVGDDVNPCSRTAPCKTFAGAISKTAAGGEINCLDPGGFGAVTINKAMTIDCHFTEGGVLAGGNGIVVNAAATDVVLLRGLDIFGVNPPSNGIRFIAGGALYVEDCIIRRFNATNSLGISFAPTTANAQLFVTNTTIADNGNALTGGGIEIAPGVGGSVKAVMRNVRVLNNSRDGIRTNSANGIVTLVLDDSNVSGQAQGLALLGSANAMATMVTNSVIANNNVIGIISTNNAITRVDGTTITGNAQGISAQSGSQILSYGGNHLDGNPTSGAANDGAFSGAVIPRK